MPTNQVGGRVVSIFKVDDKERVAYIYGHGVYEGDFYPEEAIGEFPELVKEQKRKNPRIRLDNGKVVYQCEAGYFGPEDWIMDNLEKKYDRIEEVDIDDVRKQYSNGK